MSEVFSSRLPHIYLLYGLAFFALGLAVSVVLGRVLESCFERALRPLAPTGRCMFSTSDSRWSKSWGSTGLSPHGKRRPIPGRVIPWACRERVQLAGGECHIESTPGKGTTVTVEIPLLPTKERGNGAH